MSGFAKFTRPAQRMLADAGFDQITPSELQIRGVRILMFNRAIECINEQAREAAQREYCTNCGMSLPEGCAGIFKRDGNACKLNDCSAAEREGK